MQPSLDVSKKNPTALDTAMQNTYKNTRDFMMVSAPPSTLNTSLTAPAWTAVLRAWQQPLRPTPAQRAAAEVTYAVS